MTKHASMATQGRAGFSAVLNLFTMDQRDSVSVAGWPETYTGATMGHSHCWSTCCKLVSLPNSRGERIRTNGMNSATTMAYALESRTLVKRVGEVKLRENVSGEPGWASLIKSRRVVQVPVSSRPSITRRTGMTMPNETKAADEMETKTRERRAGYWKSTRRNTGATVYGVLELLASVTIPSEGVRTSRRGRQRLRRCRGWSRGGSRRPSTPES